MATLAQIQAAVETFVANHSAKFVAVQAAYIAGHQNYWQGIATPGALPDDGALVTPDLTRKPTDQAETWAAVFTGGNALPSTNWPAQVRVDVYDGPSGRGWTLTVIVTKLPLTSRRTWNFGPETYRETGWVTE